MNILKVFVETGFSGCTYEDEIEVPDDFTYAECEEAAKTFLFDHISYNWILEGDDDA